MGKNKFFIIIQIVLKLTPAIAAVIGFSYFLYLVLSKMHNHNYIIDNGIKVEGKFYSVDSVHSKSIRYYVTLNYTFNYKNKIYTDNYTFGDDFADPPNAPIILNETYNFYIVPENPTLSLPEFCERKGFHENKFPILALSFFILISLAFTCFIFILLYKKAIKR